MIDAAGERQQSNQYDANIAFLSETPLGESLVPLYDAAVAISPRLADAVIKPIVLDSRYFYALAPWEVSNDSGRPEIHVRLEEPLGMQERCKAMLLRTRGMQEICDTYGLDPAIFMTPAGVCAYAIAHEMGHMDDYANIENNDEQEAWIQRRNTDYASLPIPWCSPPRLLSYQDSAPWEFVYANWPDIQEKWHVTNHQELIALQAEKYRNMACERAADDFAARLLRDRSDLVSRINELFTNVTI